MTFKGHSNETGPLPLNRNSSDGGGWHCHPRGTIGIRLSDRKRIYGIQTTDDSFPDRSCFRTVNQY